MSGMLLEQQQRHARALRFAAASSIAAAAGAAALIGISRCSWTCRWVLR